MALDICLGDIWETVEFGDAEVIAHDPTNRYCWVIRAQGFTYTLTDGGKVTSSGGSPQDLKHLKRRNNKTSSDKPWLDSVDYFRATFWPGWYDEKVTK